MEAVVMDSFSPGDRFCLNCAVLAIELLNGRTCAVTIPAKAVVEISVFPSSQDESMAEVIYGDRKMLIFAMDLLVRAAKVNASTA